MPDLKLYLGNGTAIYRASLLGPDTSQIPGSKIRPFPRITSQIVRSHYFSLAHYFLSGRAKKLWLLTTITQNLACTGPIQGREIAEGLGNVGGDFFRSHFVVFDYGTPAIQFAPFN